MDREQVRQTVFKTVAEQFGIAETELKPETRLVADLQTDSLDGVELVMAIEDEFGLEIPDEDAEKFQTIDSIVDYVVSRVSSRAG